MGIRLCSYWHFATDLSFCNCLRLPLPRTQIILKYFNKKLWVGTIVVEAEAVESVLMASDAAPIGILAQSPASSALHRTYNLPTHPSTSALGFFA